MSRFHQHEWDLLPEHAFSPHAGRRSRYSSMTLEGKKGGGGYKPSKAERAAMIKSMGVQDRAIEQMLANAAELAPLQREQMQFGLDTARTAYNQSQEDRTFALGRRTLLASQQDRIAADASNFDEAGRAADLRSQGIADVNAGLSSARNSAMRDAARRGMNPNAVAEAFARQGVGAASAQAQAAFMARNAAKQEGLQLTDRANNALAGYPAMASGLSGSGAGFGGAGLGYANAGLAGMNSGLNSAGMLAGQMGQNATNQFSARANAQAQAAAADPFNTILGAAAGVGAAYGLSKFG